MSTAALQDQFGVEQKQTVSPPSPSRIRAAAGSAAVRRRGSAVQGQALEMLGHAIEYLMDTHPFLPFAEHEAEQADVRAAIHLLMQSSRAVFAECPEVLPMRERLKRRLLAWRSAAANPRG